MGKAWKSLSKGDIVDIIAPSFWIRDEVVKKSADHLESLGLVPRLPDDLMGEDLLFSNSDEIRAKHLKKALYAEDSKAIWCLKGGYGAARIISELEGLEPPEQNKLVIGFSDITVLHLFLNQKWNWNTVHGPLLWQLVLDDVDKESADKISAIPFGKDIKSEFNLENMNSLGEGEIESTIIGGNLTIVQNSIGTNWQVDAKDKILLLEEIDETSYRIDRLFTHLKQAGVFEGVLAILLADFAAKKVDGENIPEVLQKFANEMNIPVLQMAGVGHNAINYPVPLNTKSVLKFGANPSIICDNGFED